MKPIFASDVPQDILRIQRILCGTVVAVYFGPGKSVVLVYDDDRRACLEPLGYAVEAIGVSEP